MSGTHDRIIAIAAREALQPIGLRRKGRSRLWFGDHGWWLTVVEFQPSGFGKGSYLNVAAHWLWSDSGYISFDASSGSDWGSRIAEFEDYVSHNQFEPAARRLAVAAAEEAGRLVRQFRSIQLTADLLLSHETSLPAQGRGSWSTYNAGIAAGLADRATDAAEMLRSISDDRVKGAADRFVRFLSDPHRFKNEAASVIVNQRKALGLPEPNAMLF